MDTPTPSELGGLSFRDPERYFSNLDAGTVARVVSSGVDIALIIESGVIKDLAIGNRELAEAGFDKAWRGKPWRDTVTPDSYRKIEELLEAAPENAGRWRQVTQIGPTGTGIPVRYTSLPGTTGKGILALGQEQSSLAQLQQRLVGMHQDLEREYASLRDAETRYRSLFEALSEPVVIVSVADGAVSEMNPAAIRRLGVGDSDPRGTVFADYISDADQAAYQRMIERALSSGRGEASEIGFRGRGSGTMRASAFRQDNDIFVIIRIEADGVSHVPVPSAVPSADIRQVMEHLPDGLVVTTSTLRILSANATFLRMVQAVEGRQVVGDQLSNWIGRSASDLNMLQSNLKRHGVARNFATVIRDRFGTETDAEISAVAADLEAETVLGFSIRLMSRRLLPQTSAEELLPNPAEEVTKLVGQLPLKEIVKSSTDFIEKLCIETALEITDQSRASAAEILGLSRQGLYSKLKRFKIPERE